MEQYMKRGTIYLDDFIQKRIGELFLRYALISPIYLVVRNNMINDDFDLITGLKQGRPIVYFSWYILGLLVLYLLFYLSCRVFGKSKKNYIVIAVAIGTFLIDFLLMKIGYGEYWYNSNWSFFIGALISLHKEKIVKFLKKVNKIEIFLTVMILCAMCFKVNGVIGTQIKCIVAIFTLLMLLQLMQVDNKIWEYIGKISLEMYLWQGLFMYGLRSGMVYIENDVLYSIITIFGTITLSIFSNCIWKIMQSKIYMR